MSTRKDPLAEAQPLDRVYYATGILLDAEDFQAEQIYHRSRLARALAYLQGSGTAAGLEVEHSLLTLPPVEPGDPPQQVEQVIVHPGLAVDRLGRLIEVPGPVCLRLDKWYVEQPTGDLTAAFREPPFSGVLVEDFAAPFTGVVVADIFVQFVVCERGKTPALASGPFDALDAVQPSRLRDSYEIMIRLRREADLTNVKPDDPWQAVSTAADATARQQALRTAIFDAWPKRPEDAPLHPEYAEDQADKTSVFLARLAIKAVKATEAGKPPTRPNPLPATPITVDNSLRSLVYTPQALAHAIGLI
jgi:hypothetical protein